VALQPSASHVFLQVRQESVLNNGYLQLKHCFLSRFPIFDTATHVLLQVRQDALAALELLQLLLLDAAAL
jgi:hypothetical protein